MKIIFLGTNGWYDTKSGNTTCIFIETRKEYIILDAGNGIYKIDQYIRKRKPVYLFLSHLHLDHIIGLHTFARFKFTQQIDIYVPPQTKKQLNRIINRPYTVPLAQLKIKVRLYEFGKKKALPLNGEFRRLRHPITCYGFKFVLDSKIISYCPDTGTCPNLNYLAKEADLFITECSAQEGKVDKKWPHLNAKEAALVARKINAKKLFLIHFNPHFYPTLKSRRQAVKRAKKIFKNTFAAFDNREIYL